MRGLWGVGLFWLAAVAVAGGTPEGTPAGRPDAGREGRPEGRQSQVRTTASLIEQGRAVYAQQCALCHEASGAGRPPQFPALKGNVNLRDLDQVVAVVRQGRGAMPPFAQLTPEDVAATAAYIRSAWGNAFGPTDVARAMTLVAGIDRRPAPVAPASEAWYTEDQAALGGAHYVKLCASCHGADFVPDDFSPGLTGAAFDWRWKTRTVYDLYETTRSTMPPDAAGSLDAATALEIVAHLLKANGFPAGRTALDAVPDRLRQMPLVRPVP